MESNDAQSIARAIQSISHGDSFPTGLEMLSIAVAGEGQRSPAGEALNNIADAINNLALALGSTHGGGDNVAVWESLYQFAKIKTAESK